MEKKFEMPSVQVIVLDKQDIITASCTLGPGGTEIG